MKALILDVDGVLNGHGVRGLDPEKLDLIAHIVVQTGCVICLSSTIHRHTLEAFVILAADPNGEIYGDLLPHLVKTDTYTGLTSDQAQEVIERLNSSLTTEPPPWAQPKIKPPATSATGRAKWLKF